MKRLAVIAILAFAHFATINWLFDLLFTRSWLGEQGSLSFTIFQFILRVLGFPFIWMADLLPGAWSSGGLGYIWFAACSVTWAIFLRWLWCISAHQMEHERIG